MRGSQKLKRVSWASDGNLCQVRLFLSDDNPSQIGLGGQDHLQAKVSWMLHSHGIGSDDDNLPPGFETTSPVDQLKNKLLLCKWSSPSTFALNITWGVVAGEESNEIETQYQREIRVLEAIYPRPSAIPPNPIVATDVENHPHDGDLCPIPIPLTPIEEDDTKASPNSIDRAPPNHGIATGPINGSSLPPGFPGPSPVYGSSIREHEGREEGNNEERKSKVRSRKVCMYFNSWRGCRKGSKCGFEHDGSGSWDAQSSKKHKIDR